MPSPLRHQLLAEPATAASTSSRHPSALQPPAKKQKMSLSQTYFLAHTARGKLSSEAARPDHNLRLLVGHANLLDALMVDLHEAEREQEAWLEATVQSAQSSKPAGVKWVDREMALDIPDGSDDEEEADSDDSDYEEEEEEEEFSIPIRRMRSPPPFKQPAFYTEEVDEADYSTDEDDDEFEDDETDESLFLVRTKSHSPDASHHISSPEVPELVSDSEPESDDESSPSSPSIPEISYTAPSPLSKTPRKPVVAQSYDDDFLHANRQSPMVAAF